MLAGLKRITNIQRRGRGFQRNFLIALYQISGLSPVMAPVRLIAAGWSAVVYLPPMSTTLLDYPASLILLVINLGVSLLAFSNEKAFDYLALAPHRMIIRREFHQVVTSGFIHSNLMHLALNMMTLYFFGPGLEATVLAATGERGAFLFIYAFSLIVGNIYPLIKYRNQPNYAAVGASGAISGVVFSYCLAHPTTTFYLFFSLPMPAWLFAILYVGYSVYAMRNVEDNIGHEAHLAGAVGGIIATFIAAPGIIVFL